MVAQRDQDKISWPFRLLPGAAAEGLANFLEDWCRGWEPNPHDSFESQDSSRFGPVSGTSRNHSTTRVNALSDSFNGDRSPPQRTAKIRTKPRSVAMSIVGHKTESIYRRYAIVDEAMQREAAARLDAWVAEPPSTPSTATLTALRRGNRLRGASRDESRHPTRGIDGSQRRYRG